MKRAVSALGCFVWLLAVSSAAAHELRPAVLDIEPKGGGRYAIIWSPPAREANATLAPPTHCDVERDPPHDDGEARLIMRLDCGPRGIGPEGIAIRGLSSASSEVLVRFKGEDGQTSTTLLRGAELRAAAQRAPTATLAYARAGFAHVLGGLDHLLFMVSLMLVARRARSLVWTVSAFTLAHAAALAFAMLELLRVPQAPLEVCIAASTMLPAARAIDRRNPGGEARLAFAFGLLHGLGFASGLRDLGVSKRELPAALLSFHAGIEAAQILSLVVVGAALAIMAKIVSRGLVRRAAAYAAGSIAFAWTIDRVAQLLP